MLFLSVYSNDAFCYSVPPQAPSKLKVSEITPESVTLKWKAPKADTPVTHYVVSKQRLGVDSEWCRVSELPADVTHCAVSDLNENTQYQFAVHTKNEAGLSEVPLLTEEPVTTKTKIGTNYFKKKKKKIIIIKKHKSVHFLKGASIVVLH